MPAASIPEIEAVELDDLELLELSQDPEERKAHSALVARAEAEIEAGRYAEAVALVAAERTPGLVFPDLALRALMAESWARMYLGELDEAVRILERARAIAESPAFSDVSRAEVLYSLGCCRVKRSEIAAAVSLYTVALELCDRSGLPCDRLRAHVLEWRSRCYQRQRDFDAARTDVERALELARGIGDRHTEAHVYFQASLIAERSREWLIARFYAEHAKEIYEDVDDQANVAKLLNNLGCLDFLLGETDSSIEHLKDSFRVALELGNEADAAQAVSSLAQVNLRTGQVELAEKQARQALELLEDRVDYLDEIGNAQLVLGRALVEQGKTAEAEQLYLDAEENFKQLSSISHRAAAWMARGELALELGDKDAAIEHYRRAAEALQDFHF
jgi:tetratricopeptide (TPR) repeat protein